MRNTWDELVYTYEYDDAGRQISKKENGVTTTYSYNDIDQLTGVTESSGRITAYAYDESGNRTEQLAYDGVLTRTDYTYNALNQLTETSELTSASTVVTEYEYDVQGNQTEKRKTENFVTETETYDYNAICELTKITLANTDEIEYTYYASGLRATKKLDNVTTEYYYSGQNLLCEKESGSQDYITNIYGIILLGRKQGSDTVFYIYNAHGDVMEVHDSRGAALVKYRYDAFGNVTEEIGSYANPYKYAGYYEDSETGNYYLNSRYYNPATGRFTSQDLFCNVDTGNGLSLNLYTYCWNNPITYIDSDGQWPKLKTVSAIKTLAKVLKPVAHKIKPGVRKLARAFADSRIGDITREGRYRTLFKLLGFDRTVDLGGRQIYHARQKCWQQDYGFNDDYDFFFDLGTNMKSVQFAFKSGNVNYVLWAWKGDYLNFGAGAELGIYYKSSLKDHWECATGQAMSMTMKLYHKGKVIIDWDPARDRNYGWDKVWWITGFNPNVQNVLQVGDLKAEFTVIFNTKKMYEDFYKIYGDPKKITYDPRWSDWDESKSFVKLTF